MKIENCKLKIDITDSRYPKLLKELGKDAPKQLYYKGNWSEEIFKNCLAVVGSRRMSSYGKQITEKLVSEIAWAGITIVSGFMYGIDAASHKAALETGGKTIAVMPCGINLIHPDYQEKLYQEILENQGLIISEYEGNFLPTLWTYPRRNRIVAGLSQATLVVEAGEKSGALITSNFSKKYKRKIFAVPGPLTSILSKGICQLIKQGAEVVTGASDVLEYYNMKTRNSEVFKNSSKNASGFSELNELEKSIIEKLQQESMEIDTLSRMLGISAAEIGTIVSLMQIKGLVFEENGKYYVAN